MSKEQIKILLFAQPIVLMQMGAKPEDIREVVEELADLDTFWDNAREIHASMQGKIPAIVDEINEEMGAFYPRPSELPIN